MKQANSLHPKVTVWLAVLTLMLPGVCSAQLADHLKQRWFVTEVVVFERLNISDDNTLEALASEQPGRQPRTLGAFVEGASPPDQYTEDTLRMLRAASLLPPLEQAPELDFAIPQRPVVAVERQPSIQASGAAVAPTELTAEQQAALSLQLQTKLAQAVAAYEADLASRSFRFAADDSPRLANEVQRLNRSRNYRVLWRGHWLQPVPTRDAPTPLLLQVDELDNGLFRLEGSLGLTVSRYLHLQAKLWYHDPAYGQPPMAGSIVAGTQINNLNPQAPNDITMPEHFRAQVTKPQFMLLDATRRMRSGMLHYLDHPKLGLLVRVDPVEPPADLLALVAAAESAQK